MFRKKVAKVYWLYILKFSFYAIIRLIFFIRSSSWFRIIFCRCCSLAVEAFTLLSTPKYRWEPERQRSHFFLCNRSHIWNVFIHLNIRSSPQAGVCWSSIVALPSRFVSVFRMLFILIDYCDSRAERRFNFFWKWVGFICQKQPN